MSPYMHLVRPSVAAPASSLVASPINVKIHSAALFTILEIVSRQVLDDKRTFGTLVGTRSDDGSSVEVRDAFLAPSQETGDSITIDELKHKTLYSLYKKAHPKESVLGWFDASAQIDSLTGLIHDFYLKGADRAYPFAAIYVNVRFLKTDKIVPPEITAYIGAAVGKPGSVQRVGWKTTTTNNSYIFSPIHHEVVSSVAEKLALGAFDGDESGLSRELAEVIENIDIVLLHLKQASTSDADIDLLRTLSNSLLSRPTIMKDPAEMKSLFAAHNQDIIMIELLARAAKEQIELSARLLAEAEKQFA